MELDGVVEYQILYVGADGGLYSAPLSGEYNLRLPMENLSDFDLNEGVCVLATCVPEGITVRVSAPRKLTLRCRMRCTVGAYGRMPMGERLLGEGDLTKLCRLSQRVPTASLMSGRSDVMLLSGELPLPFADARVVNADAGVLVGEVRVDDAGVNARGEVVVTLLCANEDGVSTREVKKIPFEGTLETEEMPNEGLAACVNGSVGELSVHVEEDKILCDLQVVLEAHIGGNTEITYTADLFSTERECRTATDTWEIPVFLGAITGNFSQSERMSASEKGISDGASVLDVYGSATADACDAREGRYVLSGQSRYVFVCEKNGEYSAAELLLPWRYECEGGDMDPDWHDVRVDVVSCRGRVNGDVLELDAELAIAGHFMGTNTIRALDHAELSSEKKKRHGDTVLCYPAPDDTLWNVAKRYMVFPEDIEGNPEKDAYLLIRE